MKFHTALAKAFADNGIGTMFGLVGDANLYMVDSFTRDHGGRFVAAASEAGAVVMALGYAAVSGELGVATVTHGPGMTNTLTGLVEGVKGRTPIVMMCGDTALADRDHMQNLAQRDLIVATGAGFVQLRAPTTLAEDLAAAIRQALIERRPVVLNVPVDFQWCDVDYAPVIAAVPSRRSLVPESPDLDAAVGIVAAARRPVILVGRGATDPASVAAIRRLADRIDAPVGTTLRGKGLFQGEAFSLGIVGTLSSPETVDAIMSADCIIAFGASLNKFTTSQTTFTNGKRVIQCNSDAADIGRYIAPAAGLVGDPGLTADLIVHWLDQAEIPASGFRSEYLAAAASPAPPAARTASPDALPDIRAVVARVNEAMPADRILATDGGRFISVPWQLIDVPDPKSLVYGVHFGAIGLGMAYAIGASFAAPGRPVLLVTGDGGFMLGGLAEFNTAVRYGVDLVVLMLNDGAYGAEHIQFVRKDMDPALTLFDWPDFAPVATALGGRGVTVRHADELDEALEAIPARDRPLLIDVKLDPDKISPH